MAERKIKVYNEINGSVTTIEENNAQTKTEVDKILGDKYQRLLFLKSNPFLYNHEMDKDKVKSIEEYIVIYKKRENSFGEFIHSTDFNKAEKIRIIKKSFKFWNKDYNKQRKENVNKNSNALKAVEVAKIRSFNLLKRILLFASFLVLLIIINYESRLWSSFKDTNFGFYLNDKIGKIFNTSWVFYIGLIGVYLFVITFFYLATYNEIIKSYKNHYKESLKMVKKTKASLKREQKKKSKTTYGYYLKNIKNGRLIFPGVKITEAAPGVLNLDFYNQVSNEIVQRTGKMKKNKWFFVTCRYLLLALSLFSFAFVIGALIFQMIIG
ncbi:MAG TPA: hypothetical protein GX695_01605 [Acholeplasmataceae bacterium]|nr:hypothetical protein [Acholeplasmataceae bacterium]